MTIEEIFNKLGSHMREGIMFHDMMAQTYDFLGLYGYSQYQIYHYIEESEGYQKLLHYYATHYYKLLQIENIEYPKLFPESWHKYTTMAVDAGTKRNAIKDLLLKWINWEKSTKKLYCEMRQELTALSEFNAVLYIDTYIKDVSKELKNAEKLLLNLETIDYNLEIIIPEQDKLYHKYKKKLRW